ncbi:MAG: hypothetical protein E2P00_04255 [Acidobacteria bacterium]|nr:MAG: hypothetical protein E2P00_04255 [Acidobacteriota bacterium]
MPRATTTRRQLRAPGSYLPKNWSWNYKEWLARWGAIEVGFFGDEKEREKQKIEKEVGTYARRYAGAWRAYLGRWELSSQGDTLQERIAALADADLKASLKPALDAITLHEDLSEAPFTSMAREIKSLEELNGFVESGLSAYQDQMRSVAEDLAECTPDNPSAFAAYRNGYQTRDSGHSLVAARRWVEDNAGPGLLGGVFKDALMKPLDEVMEWLEGGTFLQATWTGLRRFYADNIKDKAPFTSWAEDRDFVPADVLQGFMGRESGQVVQVRRASEGQDALPEALEAWLQEAEELAELIFKPHSDDFRQIRLSLDFGEPVLEPKGFRKSHRVEEVKVIAGEDSDLLWEPDLPRLPPLKIDLTPVDVPYSYVEVCIQEKSGLPLFKKFKSKTDCQRKLAKPLNGEEEEFKGFWAPIRMLQDAMTPGSDGSSFKLQFRVSEALKKKEQTADIFIDVTSSELGRLLDLLKNGFPAPPLLKEGD